ncbi:MAG TPA: thioredoxin family protein [Thermoanaerobaculia bacterium]
MNRSIILSLALVLVATIACASEELAIGAKAPGFSLTSAVDGKTVTFAPGDGKLSVVVFTCNQCPYSKAFEDRINSLARDYGAKGVVFYAVNPNDEAIFAEESMAVMKERATAKKYPMPYLKDADSSIARAYGARVTPHVFVVDGTGVVRYRGYVDDSAKPEKREHTGLSDALDALLAKSDVKVVDTNAFGCTIKWKKGA